MSASDELNNFLNYMFEVSLSESDIAEIASWFREVSKPLTIHFFVRSFKCPTCKPALKLANALKLAISMSGKEGVIKVYTHSLDSEEGLRIARFYNVSRAPSIILLNGYIRYLGIPSAEELSPFLETIVRVGTGNHGLNDEVVDELSDIIDKEAKVEVLVTPTCPYCPYVVLASNMIAYISYINKGRIVSETVELYENPDIAYKYAVMSVPAIAINNKLVHIGMLTEYDLVRAIRLTIKRE